MKARKGSGFSTFTHYMTEEAESMTFLGIMTF